MLKRGILILLLAVVNISIAEAVVSPDIKRETERATSLVEHGRYAEARHAFTLLRKRIPIDDEVLVRYVDFELARCAAELHDNEAEKIMLAFLRRYPESVHTNDVRFMLAMYYCEREEYNTARNYLDKVSYRALTADDKERYNMRMGYIEFVSGNYDKAYSLFSKLSPVGNYADHAIYYKSYVHYARGEYKEAYAGFESLKKSDNYAKVIPYYLFQIEFARGNYQYVVKNGDTLLKQSVEVERTELMRVIAEAWYRLQGYNKSFVYISMYQRSGGKMGREENYILGYSAYRSTDYATAIEALRKVAEGSDELAQNASYHLADCYIRRDNKRQAIHAFAMAADEKYNNEISEDALFNYGKLLFETGGGTFNESINVLTRYITKYPNSERADEARELLIAAYYNSHDYEMAYKAIKAFPNPDSTQRAALQKIAYFNGLEAFMVGDYDKAKSALGEAQKIGVSPKYNALCLFWLGEIEYKQGNYARAISLYDNYIRRAPKSECEYKMALYNLGYAHFSQKSMAKSQKAFEGFVWLYKTADRYRADAFNRLGDTQYAQRKYADAVKSYEGAVALGTAEQDYAKFQRAISLGLSGKMTAKIGALRQMQSENCGDYNDDAAYELGRTYVSLGRYSDGASVLEKFVDKYPQSPYYTPALLDLGLVHFNLGNSDKSLHYYDRIISSAPQSAAAKDAMQSVREIYVAKGNINDYFAYAERTGVECDLSVMARDSLSFRAAQNIYLANRTSEAISHLKEYLASYPKGYYTNDALFCLSDCYLKSDSLDRAVESLKLLAEQPQNQYTVPVVEKLARVTFDNKMYGESMQAFRRLYDVVDSAAARTEAANGYAESVLLRKDDDAVMAMANDLDTLADVDATMLRRVRFAKAKIHTSRGESVEAGKIYEKLATDVTNAEGAESAYRIIKALFAEGKLEESEKRIYALADSKTPHAYWLGKAFILLGDIYVQRNDLFQAKATYRSVVDGYTPADDGIVAEAQSKLEKLN
uniref:tetratricopeptide repeat protein n=1 Tax=Alistipes sp. TaxID=1872444 RepID=UPI004055A0B0